MPSGENMFYIDQPASHNLYGRFIGEELVAVTRAMFPLSDRREDTFIAGLSMGGYGALRNGLKYCETFGCVAGLSSAMVIDSVEEAVQGGGLFFTTRPYLESVFGDLGAVRDSDKDPARLAADLVYCDRPRPRVYMACGTEDGLLAGNRVLQDRLRGVGLDVTYEEGPGNHDWDFWNRYIGHVLDWLPLGEARSGNEQRPRVLSALPDHGAGGGYIIPCSTASTRRRPRKRGLLRLQNCARDDMPAPAPRLLRLALGRARKASHGAIRPAPRGRPCFPSPRSMFLSGDIGRFRKTVHRKVRAAPMRRSPRAGAVVSWIRRRISNRAPASPFSG